MNTFHSAIKKLIHTVYNDNFDEQLEININAASEIIKFNNTIKLKPPFNENIRWKYISFALEILLSLKDNETIISINYINDIKQLLQLIVWLGILPNVIPGVGISKDKQCNDINKIPIEDIRIDEQYYRLTTTVKSLLKCLKINSLRNFIITYHLNDLFAALFQLTYAPLKKPSPDSNSSSKFIMTEQFYFEIISEREFFKTELHKLIFELYSPKIMQELMIFNCSQTAPKWLKSSVYKILVLKLQSNDGVESLIKTLFDANILDTGSRWKQCDVLVKLILTKPLNIDENIYYTNICAQILNLLNKTNRNGELIKHFEEIVALCIKYLYEKNNGTCYQYFLNTIIKKITIYSNKSPPITENKIVTNEMFQIINLWYNCFIQTSGIVKNLPSETLNPVIIFLFNLYIVLHKSVFTEMTEKLQSILIKYIESNIENKNDIFESILFGKEMHGLLQLQENIEIKVNTENEIKIYKNDAKIRVSPFIKSDCLLDLIKIKNSETVLLALCTYLLEISINTEIKPKTSNPDLLHLETEELVIVDENTERKLIAYNLLSTLINDSKVHRYMQQNPEKIITFIEKTLQIFISNQLHISLNCDSEQYQHMFLLIMIISIIADSETINKYNTLKNTFNLIYNETPNSEMKNLISKICNEKDLKQTNINKSEFEKALEDICDPLLPVRGHGLMTIARLIENKDSEACAKKQYILNICQQHIKNEDSYIYLNAIKVLAALGDTFPEIIINILTEEYTNESKEYFDKDSETRMKIGEVLLRVIKNLGEIAPKYKSVLLNAFLSGVRDEDHLIRASSLSNLGEVCRVLGYKLGSVVTEVLSCIHAVIATDKAVEARRAAVSVIRWLFVGLEKETIVFLKDDILPIYRTLKLIYTSDPDDITRLQAQLALEELNENVRDFIFPKVQLEKKIVMLN